MDNSTVKYALIEANAGQLLKRTNLRVMLRHQIGLLFDAPQASKDFV